MTVPDGYAMTVCFRFQAKVKSELHNLLRKEQMLLQTIDRLNKQTLNLYKNTARIHETPSCIV